MHSPLNNVPCVEPLFTVDDIISIVKIWTEDAISPTDWTRTIDEKFKNRSKLTQEIAAHLFVQRIVSTPEEGEGFYHALSFTHLSEAIYVGLLAFTPGNPTLKALQYFKETMDKVPLELNKRIERLIESGPETDPTLWCLKVKASINASLVAPDSGISQSESFLRFEDAYIPAKSLQVSQAASIEWMLRVASATRSYTPNFAPMDASFQLSLNKERIITVSSFLKPDALKKIKEGGMNEGAFWGIFSEEIASKSKELFRYHPPKDASMGHGFLEPLELDPKFPLDKRGMWCSLLNDLLTHDACVDATEFFASGAIYNSGYYGGENELALPRSLIEFPKNYSKNPVKLSFLAGELLREYRGNPIINAIINEVNSIPDILGIKKHQLESKVFFVDTPNVPFGSEIKHFSQLSDLERLANSARYNRTQITLVVSGLVDDKALQSRLVKGSGAGDLGAFPKVTILYALELPSGAVGFIPIKLAQGLTKHPLVEEAAQQNPLDSRFLSAVKNLLRMGEFEKLIDNLSREKTNSTHKIIAGIREYPIIDHAEVCGLPRDRFAESIWNRILVLSENQRSPLENTAIGEGMLRFSFEQMWKRMLNTLHAKEQAKLKSLIPAEKEKIYENFQQIVARIAEDTSKLLTKVVPSSFHELGLEHIALDVIRAALKGQNDPFSNPQVIREPQALAKRLAELNHTREIVITIEDEETKTRYTKKIKSSPSEDVDVQVRRAEISLHLKNLVRYKNHLLKKLNKIAPADLNKKYRALTEDLEKERGSFAPGLRRIFTILSLHYQQRMARSHVLFSKLEWDDRDRNAYATENAITILLELCKLHSLDKKLKPHHISRHAAQKSGDLKACKTAEISILSALNKEDTRSSSSYYRRENFLYDRVSLVEIKDIDSAMFIYAIDFSGNPVLSHEVATGLEDRRAIPPSHSQLVNGLPVKSAGEVLLDRSVGTFNTFHHWRNARRKKNFQFRLSEVNNGSGHYKPSHESTKIAVQVLASFFTSANSLGSQIPNFPGIDTDLKRIARRDAFARGSDFSKLRDFLGQDESG